MTTCFVNKLPHPQTTHLGRDRYRISHRVFQQQVHFNPLYAVSTQGVWTQRSSIKGCMQAVAMRGTATAELAKQFHVGSNSKCLNLLSVACPCAPSGATKVRLTTALMAPENNSLTFLYVHMCSLSRTKLCVGLEKQLDTPLLYCCTKCLYTAVSLAV